ncbi:MAG: COX15/CtaA family protein [Polyangiaceae bacterium]|nr:COX15/CtaA family protein [Polyangiaceae bacterium]
MRSGPSRAVGIWLLLVAGAVVVQVVLGGITRLTDSGLSITEWQPLLGVVPPLDDAGWEAAFARYREIPQYQLLKRHLTLEEFRGIYFWEWLHRVWARLLGVAFAAPLVVFWRRGLARGLERRLLALLALGGLQGVVGWIMVASGLSERVYVSHLRLAAHFLLAAALLAALVWEGLAIVRPPPQQAPPRALRVATAALGAGLFVQFAWGAFMAGLKAGLAAPTWPSIRGEWLPAELASGRWWWDEPLAIHFVHRTLAYGLTFAIAWWWWRARSWLRLERHLVLGLVMAQVVLGVVTTLNAYFEDRLLVLGVAHQLVGVLLLAALVAAAERLRPPPAPLAAPP